jgi:predicted transcriptional regulator
MRPISLFIIFLNLAFSFSGYAQTEPRVDTLDARNILRGETVQAHQHWLRRQLFVENIFTQTPIGLNDSTLLFRLQRKAELGLDKSPLTGIPSGIDVIDEQLRREQLGIPPLSNLGNLLGAGVKYLAEKLGGGGTKVKPFAVIPSESEIEVLKILWKETRATSSEIYAQLDSARITAADLQQILAVMTQRGLLEREQISPRHEFTVLGGITLEMSARNRKNREYIYWPKVTRQAMLTFLDATAFSHRIASGNSHSLGDQYIYRLINKLIVPGD